MSEAELLRKLLDELESLRDREQERAVALEDDWGENHPPVLEAHGIVEGVERAGGVVKAALASLESSDA